LDQLLHDVHDHVLLFVDFHYLLLLVDFHYLLLVDFHYLVLLVHYLLLDLFLLVVHLDLDDNDVLNPLIVLVAIDLVDQHFVVDHNLV
jgi:hypothetical protein